MEHLLFTIGLVIGVIASTIIHNKRTTNGTLKVDMSDPDGPFMFLSLSREELDAIYKKDYIIAKIEVNFPQK